MNIAELYKIYLEYPFIQTDSRKLKAGEIFFALKGENFNGNQFAEEAIHKGAAAVIVDEEINFQHSSIIRVDNALSALQELAKYHRLQFNIPFLAITGSNGKTTTKELIHAVLSTHYKTYTTEGNLNNHIGIPLTILKIKPDAEMAVIEMGANHQKEIEGYCTYTLPTHGLITNIGKAHLEGFGGIEGVKKGKGELFDFLRYKQGTVFVYNDQDELKDLSKGLVHTITYGTHKADINGKIIQAKPFLAVHIETIQLLDTLQTQLVGDYNCPNVLAAVAVGMHFKVPVEKIKKAIESYAPTNSRSQLIKSGSNDIVLDAYNANPSSMSLAIKNFAQQTNPHKILLLGSMAELGEESQKEHQQIIDLIQTYSWDAVVLVGKEFEKVNHPFKQFNNAQEAGLWLKKYDPQHSSILIKGSRSSKMEKTIEDIINHS
jgi:UDP-N-acetylmuramoyl-tripeptide--D-alanyl-D-alanine ligase